MRLAQVACDHCGGEHEASHAYCPATGKLIPSRLFPPGTLLEGKYRIGRALGLGGMGAVFEATHTLLDRRVAIKVILPGGTPGATGDQLAARLVREARAASSTGHRNVTQVLDLGQADGRLYMVMELLEGRTLKELLADGPLPVPRAAGLMLQALSGLEAVHKKGIIHRDLKPDNLMLVQDDDGVEVVKLLDFGISKVAEAQGGLTSAGLVMGTPQFMSPEQASAAQLDHRTDLYSAGAILYFMVTGQLPFPDDLTLPELIACTVEGRFDPPSRRKPDLAPEVDAIVLRAMARRPEDRFQDARDFSQALGPFAGDSAAGEEGLDWSPAALDTTGPPPAAAFSFAADLDESSLILLDGETEPAPAPPAAPPAATVAAGPSAALQEEPAPAAPERRESGADDRFLPPEEQQQALELDDGLEAPARPAPRRTTPRPSAPAAPSAEPAPALQSVSTGEIRRAGTARHRPPSRVGLWVALALVAVGGGAYYLLAGRTPPPPPAPAAAQMVTITFLVTPREAELLVDGVAQRETTLTLKRGPQLYEITVRAKDYFSERVSFRADEDQTLRVTLKPRRVEGAPSRRTLRRKGAASR